VIKLVLSDGNQTITKICNNCKCHIEDLTTDDILVKGDTDLTIKDSQGNVVTRTELPNSLVNCECEDCQ
tara:strand:- start:86 stop:292 length:207 start_codon:yes stop_codon:yes gene_type:complete